MNNFARRETQTLILDTIPSIVVVLDADGVIMEWNRAAQAIFDIESQQALGQGLNKLAVEWDAEGLVQRIGMAMQQNKPQRLEVDYKLANGKKGLLGITLIPFQDSRAEHRGCILQGAEITDRKRMENQLAHAQKMESIGQLAAGIAHEINTPTQYIGDNLRFLQESFEGLRQVPQAYQTILEEICGGVLSSEIEAKIEALNDELDLEYLYEEIPLALAQSLDGVKQVSRIVRAMKEFSHPDAQEKTLADLNAAIDSTITVARNEWKYVADVELTLDPKLPAVPCLLGDFNQAILNIVVNAAHAIGDKVKTDPGSKGKISVTSKTVGPWAEVRISDTGMGIPPAARTRIFDPFFTTKAVGKGTGQGLVIAYSVVVEKHQGTIGFETEEGVGTTFIIRLPLDAVETKNA